MTALSLLLLLLLLPSSRSSPSFPFPLSASPRSAFPAALPSHSRIFPLLLSLPRSSSLSSLPASPPITSALPSQKSSRSALPLPLPISLAISPLLPPLLSLLPSLLPSPPSPLFPNSTRSTFPFAVTGILSNLSILTGTMYSANFPLMYLFSPSISTPSPTTYPSTRLSPPLTSLTITTLSFTPPYSLITPSISPNSIRYPLIFTWLSRLPTYSILPSLRYLPMSPVRYIRPPSPSNGLGTYLSAVASLRFRYPRVNIAPSIYISPRTPIALASIPSSNTYTRAFVIGLPIPGSSLLPFSISQYVVYVVA